MHSDYRTEFYLAASCSNDDHHDGGGKDDWEVEDDGCLDVELHRCRPVWVVRVPAGLAKFLEQTHHYPEELDASPALQNLTLARRQWALTDARLSTWQLARFRMPLSNLMSRILHICDYDKYRLVNQLVFLISRHYFAFRNKNLYSSATMIREQRLQAAHGLWHSAGRHANGEGEYHGGNVWGGMSGSHAGLQVSTFCGWYVPSWLTHRQTVSERLYY